MSGSLIEGIIPLTSLLTATAQLEVPTNQTIDRPTAVVGVYFSKIRCNYTVRDPQARQNAFIGILCRVAELYQKLARLQSGGG
jgi:hypothetical protein